MPSFTVPLPAELIDELAAVGCVRSVGPGTVVADEGERAESFCVIRKGVFRVLMAAPDGRSVVLGYLSAGEYFGETMIDGGNRVATVESCSPGELVCVPRAQFLGFIVERPDFARYLLVKMTGLLRRTLRFTKHLALLEVHDRVRVLLAELAEDRDGLKIISPRPSQQAIGELVGASRSMINRVMKQLAAEGFATPKGDALVISDTRVKSDGLTPRQY